MTWPRLRRASGGPEWGATAQTRYTGHPRVGQPRAGCQPRPTGMKSRTERPTVWCFEAGWEGSQKASKCSKDDGTCEKEQELAKRNHN